MKARFCRFGLVGGNKHPSDFGTDRFNETQLSSSR